MKLVIERGELLRALGHVTSVVERRTTIPILSNVMLKASGQEVEFKATDLEREVIEQAPASISKPGAATVPAHVLHDIVRKLPDGSEVELSRDPERDRLMLVSGHARFALQILPAEDFPDIGSGEMQHSFEVGAHELKRLIDKTRFAISTEETRYYLNGIYLHATKAASGEMVLRAVATDGHRLAQVEIPCPKGAEGMAGVIVPRKTVHELNRLLEASTQPVGVSVSPAKIKFEIGTITMTSKLIDGTFPDYGRVIPKQNDKELKISNAQFMSAVDRVATIASERSRAVKLNIGADKLVLTVNNPDGGSATEEIPVDYGEVRFMMADSGSPTIVRDGDDVSALYVLMPMRV